MKGLIELYEINYNLKNMNKINKSITWLFETCYTEDCEVLISRERVNQNIYQILKEGLDNDELRENMLNALLEYPRMYVSKHTNKAKWKRITENNIQKKLEKFRIWTLNNKKIERAVLNSINEMLNEEKNIDIYHFWIITTLLIGGKKQITTFNKMVDYWNDENLVSMSDRQTAWDYICKWIWEHKLLCLEKFMKERLDLIENYEGFNIYLYDYSTGKIIFI